MAGTRTPGYYDFNTLTYGIAQALSLSEYLAHIMVEGEQPFDMAAEFDPLRYGRWATPDYVASKVAETYGANNCVTYPHENRPAGREHVEHPAGRRALHAALAERGALFGFSHAGVEVPLVFARPEGGASAAAAPPSFDQQTFASHTWAARAETEARLLLDGVGLGLSSYSKLHVSSGASDGATRLLQRATTNAVPRQAGRCRLTYATTRAGNVLGEFTVTRLADEAHDFYLVGSRDYAQHDLAWLEQHLARLAAAGELDAADVTLADATDEYEILHLAGPAAPRLMAALCPEAASLPFLQMRPLSVCGVAARVFRISFTGQVLAGLQLHPDRT